MQKLPDKITSEDISLWLRETYVYSTSHKCPVQYAEVTGRRTIRALTSDDDVSVAIKDVRTHWPECGAINVDGGALYVQRQPSRHYRRSYAPRRCTLSVLGMRWQENSWPDAMMKGTSDWDVVKALFDPSYPTDVEAALVLLKTLPSVALNRHLTFVRGIEDQILVYLADEMVGVLEGGEFTAECTPRTVKRLSKMTGGLLI